MEKKLERQISQVNALANRLLKGGLTGSELKQILTAVGQINSGKTLAKLNSINKDKTAGATLNSLDDKVKVDGGITTTHSVVRRNFGGEDVEQSTAYIYNNSLGLKENDQVISASLNVRTDGENVTTGVNVVTGVTAFSDGQSQQITSGPNLNTTIPSLSGPLDVLNLNSDPALRNSATDGLSFTTTLTNPSSPSSGTVSGTLTVKYFRPLVLSGAITSNK